MLDDIDRQIVDILRRDGRLSCTEIGKTLGLSRVAIHKRLQKLIDEKAIEITAFINPSKSGEFVNAIIGLDLNNRDLSNAFSVLQKQPAVVRVTTTQGRFNLLVIVIFKDIAELSKFLIQVVYKLPGVKNLEVFLLLHMGEKNEPTRFPLTQLDQQIINLLRANGRLTASRIARTLGVNAITVQRRIQRLTSAGLIRIVALVIQGKFDWVNYAAFGVTVDRSRLVEIAAELSRLKSVEYVFSTLGRFNLFLSVEANSKDTIYDIEDKLIGIKGVRHYELFVSLDTARGPSGYGLHFE